ncbi:hypothetical protein [Burkholderia alba]|uniref:hypothetical protein n=1 Tax=Burkholderia alba TaxID=2683677 RepID=UPI002B05F93C|nr:hypothetical protein [Burkholderia alba]
MKWLLAGLAVAALGLSLARLAGADAATLAQLAGYAATVAIGALVGLLTLRRRKPGDRDGGR